MIAKIRNYIQRAFEDVPNTKKAHELQEELISNLIDKFNDQLKAGRSEEEAYNHVIAGIGDLSELTEGLRERHVLSTPSAIERKRSAKIVAIAIMLYILSPVSVIIFSELTNTGSIGVVGMFALIATATGLLIYNQSSKPRYYKEEETMIEEFKEWKSKNQKNKALHSALSTAYWLAVVGIYLYVNFTFYTWHYSWIIFIIAAAFYNLVKALILLGKKDESN